MPRWLGLTSPAMSSTVSGTTPSHRDRKIKLLFPDRPLVETRFSRRDLQEGDDDDDRDSRTDWGRSGPGWAHVAQTQARFGAAYAPGGRPRDPLARTGRDGCNPERVAGHLRGGG